MGLDMVLIEAASVHNPDEVRPVIHYSARGHDKPPVCIRYSSLIRFGLGTTKGFAEEMIEECAAFPFGAHDDLCDTMTQALRRFP